MKKIYRKLGSDSVVVNAKKLVVLTRYGEKPANKPINIFQNLKCMRI